jgi:hypothetical protein
VHGAAGLLEIDHLKTGQTPARRLQMLFRVLQRVEAPRAASNCLSVSSRNWIRGGLLSLEPGALGSDFRPSSRRSAELEKASSGQPEIASKSAAVP